MTAMGLAKYVVDKCIEDSEPISNLQLQKILYYIQRNFLKRGDPAFDDDIEAWQFGPVVPEVYYNFCGFGAMPISFLIDNIDEDALFKDNTDAKQLVDTIVEEKRKLKPWDMVEDTHQKGGAWDTVYKGGEGNKKVIPRTLIKEKG